jgi:integrase
MTGNIRQRTPGSWTIQVYRGRNAQGKKQYESKTIRGTKRDAQAELNKILHELAEGNHVRPQKMTLADLLDRWLRNYAAGAVTGTTYERYQQIVEQHLVPGLGAIPLQDLEPIQVQEYYTEAMKSGRVNPVRDQEGKIVRAGLSARSVQQIHSVLRKALKCAVR